MYTVQRTIVIILFRLTGPGKLGQQLIATYMNIYANLTVDKPDGLAFHINKLFYLQQKYPSRMEW